MFRSCPDFSFGFKNKNFSDKVLVIRVLESKIPQDLNDIESSQYGCNNESLLRKRTHSEMDESGRGGDVTNSSECQRTENGAGSVGHVEENLSESGHGKQSGVDLSETNKDIGNEEKENLEINNKKDECSSETSQSNEQIIMGKKFRSVQGDILIKLYVNSMLLGAESEIFRKILTEKNTQQTDTKLESQTSKQLDQFEEYLIDLENENEVDLMCTLIQYIYCGKIEFVDNESLDTRAYDSKDEDEEEGLELEFERESKIEEEDVDEELDQSQSQFYQYQYQIKLEELLKLADKFGIRSAMTECAKLLSNPSTFNSEVCCRCLELVGELNDSKPIRGLINFACQFLEFDFHNFEKEWVKPRFLDLSLKALQVLYKSENIKIMSENTLFCSLLHWLKYSPERKDSLDEILPFLRFPMMTPDYLLNIVDYQIESKNLLHSSLPNLIMEAKNFHLQSIEKKKVSTKKRFLPRTSARDPSKATLKVFRCHFSEIHTMTEKEIRMSPQFYCMGYCFRLVLERKNVDQEDGGTLGIFLFVDPDLSGLPPTFFLTVHRILKLKSNHTNSFETISTGMSNHTNGETGFGLSDALGCPWKSIQYSKFLHNFVLFIECNVFVS